MGGLSIKTDGTLWGWGGDRFGQLGQNESNKWYSSPVQVGSGTDWSKVWGGEYGSAALKTNGTLWMTGRNQQGELGQNNNTSYSSPTQIPGTWAHLCQGQGNGVATKTDGTLWVWGYNDYGSLGLNNTSLYSSPTQIPGTNWSMVVTNGARTFATKSS